VADVEIKVRKNGPYKVTGPIRLIDADGNEYEVGAPGESIVLCRCGGSTTKPFCDGTHRRTGFQAAEKAGREARSPAPNRNPSAERPK
jgi:CDGSH-type Zn-finger protein